MTSWPRGDDAQQPLPLMLLPGTLCDANLFTPMLEAMPSDRPVVIGDVGSHSSSEALAVHLLEKAPPRFALAGFSLGGIVAIAMARLAPDRIAGVALISSTARPVPIAEQERRRARAATAESPVQLVTESWSAQVAAAHVGNSVLRDTIIGMAARANRTAFHNQTELALTRPDNRPRLAALPMPSLVLAGEEDAINPPKLQHEMAALLPDAELALIPDAGHFLPLEAPRPTAAAIAAWLGRVEAARWADGQAEHRLARQSRAAVNHR